MSWGVKLGSGLDGCARWRKVTITLAVKLNWNIFQKNLTNCCVKLGCRLDGFAPGRKGTVTVTVAWNEGVVSKTI